jgi:hypothetical protein
MIADHEYEQPARLKFFTADPTPGEGSQWDDAEDFETLRDALHRLMDDEGPAGLSPWILTASDRLLTPQEITLLLNSFEGP